MGFTSSELSFRRLSPHIPPLWQQLQSSVYLSVWSSQLGNFNQERTREQQHLTFVTRVCGTWTMCAQWAGKLMTAYFWRLCTCSVKGCHAAAGDSRARVMKTEKDKASQRQALWSMIFLTAAQPWHITHRTFIASRIFPFICSVCSFYRPGPPWCRRFTLHHILLPNRTSEGLVMFRRSIRTDVLSSSHLERIWAWAFVWGTYPPNNRNSESAPAEIQTTPARAKLRSFPCCPRRL